MAETLTNFVLWTPAETCPWYFLTSSTVCSQRLRPVAKFGKSKLSCIFTQASQIVGLHGYGFPNMLVPAMFILYISHGLGSYNDKAGIKGKVPLTLRIKDTQIQLSNTEEILFLKIAQH